MTPYLAHLTARVLNPGDSLQPRLGSRFEPLPQGGSTLPLTDAEPPLSPDTADLEGTVAVATHPAIAESLPLREHLNAEAVGLRPITPPSPRPDRAPAPAISVSTSVVPVDADRPLRQSAVPAPPSPEPRLSPPPQSSLPSLPQGRLNRGAEPIAPLMAPLPPAAPLTSTAENAARPGSEPGLPEGDRSLQTPSSVSSDVSSDQSVRPPLSSKLRPQVSMKLPIVEPVLSPLAKVNGSGEVPQFEERSPMAPAEQGAKPNRGASRLNSPQPSPPISPQRPLPEPGLIGLLSAVAPPQIEQSRPLRAPQEALQGLTVLGVEATTSRRVASQTLPAETLLPVPFRADRRAGQTLQPRVEPLPSLPAEMATQPDRTTVNISIGRIEVRAVPPRRATPRAARAPAAPVTSLSTYLHSGGQR